MIFGCAVSTVDTLNRTSRLSESVCGDHGHPHEGTIWGAGTQSGVWMTVSRVPPKTSISYSMETMGGRV